MENYSKQTEISKQKNFNYFLHTNSQYRKAIETIDTYENISKEINSQIVGFDNLADIGNGGIFRYDTNLVGNITGIDLFLDNLEELDLPSNIIMINGDALNLPKNLSQFDGVLMVMLVHHLVGRTVEDCHSNLKRCFSEAYNILKPGGKFIVVESCLPFLFYQLEKIMYRPVSYFIKLLLNHPPVFQYSIQVISEMLLKSGFNDVNSYKIQKGNYVLQLGIKFPSRLTPTQPYMTIGKK